MSDNLNINVTLDAFSKIVVEKWRQRMLIAGVGVHANYSSTRNLFRSFQFNMMQGRIDFTFLRYGHYVDRGVGGEIFKGNSGDLGFTPKRKAKKWYYAVFMNQARALERIMADKFGIAASIYVSESWESIRMPVANRSYDSAGNSTRVNPLFEARKQELELLRNWVK